MSLSRIDSNSIAANAISAVDLADGSITSAKIEANAITSVKIEANAITSLQVAANAITSTKIAANVTLQVAAGSNSSPSISVGGDPDTGIFFPAANNIGFATGGVIRGRWTTDGLCFGSDTAAANALDDYEEGTWTPSVGGNATYGTRIGNYTKIGNTVRAFFDISITTIGTGSTTTISGYPFSCLDNSAGCISYYINSATNVTWVSLQMSLLTSLVVGTVTAQGAITNGINIFGNGTRLIGTVVYDV